MKYNVRVESSFQATDNPVTRWPEMNTADADPKTIENRNFILSGLRNGDSGVWYRARPRVVGLDQVLTWWREYFSARGQPGHPERLRVYTHIPFCRQICSFCRYWRRKLGDPAQLDQVVGHLECLMDRFFKEFGRMDVSAAYLGGGTPSLLTPDLLTRYFRSFNRTFDVGHEFTMEAHTRFLDREKLKVIADGGIIRVSLGVQSTDPEVLAGINRIPTEVDHLADCISFGQDLGMLMNVDLVFGLPEQTRESFLKDVDTMLELGTGLLHTYRYLPVYDLQGRVDHPEFAMEEITELVQQRAESRGYTMDPPEDDQVGRLALRRADEFGRARGRTKETEQYTFFDDTRANLLGLGTGAVSHVHGRAWFREVTSLARQDLGSALYVASPLTPEDEWKTALLRAACSRESFSFDQLYQRTGFDGLGNLPGVADHLVNQEVFTPIAQDRPGLVARNPRVASAALTRLQELALPDLEDDPLGGDLVSEPGRAVRALAQMDLLPLGTRHPRELEPAMKAWLKKMGVKSLSSRICGHQIASVCGELIEFQVEPCPAPRLILRISESGKGKQMYGSARFSLSLVGRQLSELSERELDLMNRLMLALR